MTPPLNTDDIRDLTSTHARLALIAEKGSGGALARDAYVANAHRLAAVVPALVDEVDQLRRDLAANEGSEDARLAIAEAEVKRLEGMLADAKYTVGQVLQGRDSAHAELADVLHDLQVAVGATYASAPSAAIEAVRRIAVAEAEVERLRPVVEAARRATATDDVDDWNELVDAVDRLAESDAPAVTS